MSMTRRQIIYRRLALVSDSVNTEAVLNGSGIVYVFDRSDYVWLSTTGLMTLVGEGRLGERTGWMMKATDLGKQKSKVNDPEWIRSMLGNKPDAVVTI